MNLLEQAQYFLESKGFLVENIVAEELGFEDKNSANVFYYIGRYIENKGPQTSAAIEKYLDTKFNGDVPAVNVQEKSPVNWATFLGRYFDKDGRKWVFTADTHDWWEEVAKWHEANAEAEDPNAKYVKQFFDWYNEKKKGNETNPPKDLIKYINSTSAEDVEKTFGKYYKFAMGQLDKYLDMNFLSDEDKYIQKFWDWHRAKKAGKSYQLDQDTIDGLVTFLRKPKAVEVLQQYYYYFVRVIEKLSDKNIKTPINTTGLQKELQRIMDNLENDDFVDELERIERNRLRGGDMTAGPVFVLPTEVIKSIRSLAKDTNNINKEKVGKIDKSQVKDCYAYCVNELNRKFHVGKTGIFDLNIQDFYDTYKIVFQRGFNTKTLHKIFDEVSQYLLDQLDKGTAEYWKNRGKIEQDEIDDFNEAYKALQAAGYTILKEDKYMDDMEDELEEVGGQNKDLAELKKYAPNIEINGQKFKFEYDDRYTITGKSWYNGDDFHGFSFKLFDNKLNKPVTSKYNDIPDDFSFYIKKNRDDFVNFGPVEKFLDTTIPFEIKEWEKKNRPGFFKRLFKNESAEDDVLQHGLSPFDKARLEKGQKPSWASKVTEIGPRAKRPAGSKDWSERAMRAVRGEREPYRESDWKKDNEFRLKENERIAEELKSLLQMDNAKFKASKDNLGVYFDDKKFLIESRGLSYYVKMIGYNSVFDRKSETLKSLKDIANFIKENV